MLDHKFIKNQGRRLNYPHPLAATAACY